MLRTLRGLVEGTPLEPTARWAYTRFWPSRSAQYDRQTRAVMQRVLRHDANCIDVGAHRGNILREMVSLAPDGRHFAFEPLPAMAAELRRQFPGVAVFDIALSDVTGESTFCHVLGDPGLSGLRPTNTMAQMQTEELRVQTARLDDMIPPTRKIALIKIDVEGAEYLVFRGAGKLLCRDRPVIVFECGAGAADRYVDDPASKVLGLLGEFGLSVSLMERWLRGEPPFSRDQFLEQFGARTNFYFIAYPLTP
jgi:FkbM family methyltransferase